MRNGISGIMFRKPATINMIHRNWHLDRVSGLWIRRFCFKRHFLADIDLESLQ